MKNIKIVIVFLVFFFIFCMMSTDVLAIDLIFGKEVPDKIGVEYIEKVRVRDDRKVLIYKNSTGDGTIGGGLLGWLGWYEGHSVDPLYSANFVKMEDNRYYLTNIARKEGGVLHYEKGYVNIDDVVGYIIKDSGVIRYCETLSMDELEKLAMSESRADFMATLRSNISQGYENDEDRFKDPVEQNILSWIRTEKGLNGEVDLYIKGNHVSYLKFLIEVENMRITLGTDMTIKGYYTLRYAEQMLKVYEEMEIEKQEQMDNLVTLKLDSLTYKNVRISGENGWIPRKDHITPADTGFLTVINAGQTVRFVANMGDEMVKIWYKDKEYFIRKSDLEGSFTGPLTSQQMKDKEEEEEKISKEITESLNKQLQEEADRLLKEQEEYDRKLEAEKKKWKIYLGLQDSDSVDKDIDGMISDATSFVGAKSNLGEGSLQSFSETIYNTLLIFASAISIIMGLMLGIKFMLSSVEEKAEIKQLAVPYLVGCIVVFGSFGIWKLVVVLFSNAV